MTDNGIQFERPVGPVADTKELEYIAALHQTNVEQVRENGTIHSKDIRNFLTSRHGVYVEHTKIEEHIIKEMCGTIVNEDDEDKPKPKSKKKREENDPMMDLCQMVTLLAIPYLRQEQIAEAAKPSNSLVHGMVEQVLKLILEECERNKVNLSQFRAVDDNFETGLRITPKLIQAMLDCYGEYHVPMEIIEEMAAMATAIPNSNNNHNSSNNNDDSSARSKSSNSSRPKDSSHNSSNNSNNKDDSNSNDPYDSQPRLKTKPAHIARALVQDNDKVVMLNKDTFLNGLTADVQLYNPHWEHLQTTHFQDALTTPVSNNNNRIEMNSTFYTAPSIDQSAEQYRSVAWTILLWITFIIYYVCYMLDEEGTVHFDSCQDEFLCDMGSSVVNWLIILAGLGKSGLLFVFLGSLGNSTALSGLGAQKALTGIGILLAMGMIASATLVPAFLTGEAFVWDIDPMVGWEPLYWFCFTLGILLICLQIIRFVDNCVPLGALGAGGRTRSEQCTKEAATKRMKTMMDNAMLLHVAPALPGEQVKSRSGWKCPAKHSSLVVIKAARELHDEKDKVKGLSYRDGSNVEALTDGEGHERALRHYKEMTNVTETTGGVLWAYERMADGRLFDEEGVWLSARLLASNCIQWLVSIMVVVFYFAALAWYDDNKENTIEVGVRRLEESYQQQRDALKEYVETYEKTLREKQLQHQHLQRRRQKHLALRRLQFIESYNSTHYQVTGQEGVYPNLIYDLNSTHFTDGTTLWAYSKNSHNGTHVFDKYFPYNETGFSDGKLFYPYSEYATNGTHYTNGDYLFDGALITPIPGNNVVNSAEEWEFKLGTSFGLVAAIVATVGIAVVYIPSFASTVIKFRSGLYPSLKAGPKFQQLRDNPHRVTTLLGSAMWGSIYTGCFSALFVGGIVFLAVWSETRPISAAVIAFFIGVLAVWLIKFVVVRIFRNLYISSFYRRHPAVINFLNVMLESWNLGLAVLSMMVRSIKLLIVTMGYIGRIDVPTFSPGVGYVGPFPLDSEHFIFKHDLLIHEAHRHPLIERLGMMYLMKIHHGSDFGTKAGAYWRLLFVLALMPWMRDYRIRHFGDKKPKRDDDDDDDDDDSYDEENGMKKGNDTGSVMSLHGMDIEMDIVKRANESLKQRNSDLKQAMADLRAKLREEKKSVLRLQRRVERLKDKNKNAGRSDTKSNESGMNVAEKHQKVGKSEEKSGAASNEVEVEDVSEESFESEPGTNGGTSGVEKGSSKFLEDDFQSDSESETFSQVVAKEKEKLIQQRQRSDELHQEREEPSESEESETFSQAVARAKEKLIQQRQRSDEMAASNDEGSASPEALHESEESQIQTSAESGNSNDYGTSGESGTSEEFEDEYQEEEEGEESLANILKKNIERMNDRSSRDPD